MNKKLKEKDEVYAKQLQEEEQKLHRLLQEKENEQKVCIIISNKLSVNLAKTSYCIGTNFRGDQISRIGKSGQVRGYQFSRISNWYFRVRFAMRSTSEPPLTAARITCSNSGR